MIKKISGANNPNYKNGHSMKRQGYYNTWQNMKSRCLRTNHPKYKNYGGRGIKIYEPWLKIENFAEWALSNGWEKGCQIDRIDNDGDYTPENCHWINIHDNSRKKSTTKLSMKDADNIRSRVRNGESEHDIAKEYGVVHGTVWFVVNNYTHVEDGECTKKLKDRAF